MLEVVGIMTKDRARQQKTVPGMRRKFCGVGVSAYYLPANNACFRIIVSFVAPLSSTMTAEFLWLGIKDSVDSGNEPFIVSL